MIETIVDSLAATLKANLAWGDVSVGIVTEMKIMDKDGNEITFPVYLLKDELSCVTGDYINMIPDSSKKSMIYFELESNVCNEYNKTRGAEMEASLTLICWFNYKKIDQEMKNAEYIFADILDNLPQRLSSDNSVYITVTSKDIKDGSVFDKYDYKDGMQYTKYPYDYVSIGLNIVYRLKPFCVTVNDNPLVC